MVEAALGRRRYILLSGICAVSSMMGFMLLAGGPTRIYAGYSGVINGLLVALALYYPNDRILLYAIFPVKMRTVAILLVIVQLHLSVSGSARDLSRLSDLFGALGAWLYVSHIRKTENLAGQSGGQNAFSP